MAFGGLKVSCSKSIFQYSLFHALPLSYPLEVPDETVFIANYYKLINKARYIQLSVGILELLFVPLRRKLESNRFKI